MADRIVEEHVHTDGGGAAMGVLAVALILIVFLVVLYFTGAFGRMFGSKENRVEINVNDPSVVLTLK